MKPPYTRKVIYDELVNIDYSEFSSAYMNWITGFMIPNTEVYIGGKLRFKINSLGCKGDELAGGNPVIGYFGDSGIFGSGMDSWTQRIWVPGTQNLNASVEGHSMSQVIEQYERLKGDVDFIAGVFYTGWHNIFYGETGEEFWRGQLDRIDGLDVIVHCTPPSCLTEECLEKGLEPLLNDGRDRPFEFWTNKEATRENIIRVYENHLRYKIFLTKYCEEKGRLHIDLDTYLKPKSYDAIPDTFRDVAHFRPSNYGKVAVHVTEQIGGAVSEALNRRGNPADAPAPDPKLAAVLPMRAKKWKKNKSNFDADIYPIW